MKTICTLPAGPGRAAHEKPGFAKWLFVVGIGQAAFFRPQIMSAQGSSDFSPDKILVKPLLPDPTSTSYPVTQPVPSAAF